jgi:DNA mismatch endonuclease (patch repair protein)
MSRIRGKGTKPEVMLCDALRDLGVEFDANVEGLPGKPDVVPRGSRLAVFMNGCFWHGCPRHYREPKSNVEFWRRKIGNNRRRDARVRKALNRAGWSVMVLWEHDVRRDPARAAARIARRMETAPRHNKLRPDARIMQDAVCA